MNNRSSDVMIDLLLLVDRRGDIPPCSFPSWLHQGEWFDFNGENVYSTNGDSELVISRVKSTAPYVIGRTTHRFTCVEIETQNMTLSVLQVRAVHRW